MKRIPVLAVLFFLSILSFASGRPTTTQQNASNGRSTKQRDTKTGQDDVVRISVTLVQVDIAVTDRDGKQITNLKPEDFEIYEDGRLQQITNFSMITSETPAITTRSSSSPKSNDKLAPPVPNTSLRPDEVKRAIALVVDDLGLSFASTGTVRDALKKFVDQQMQPGDLVAIVRTGAGMGALQQFTADKRQLYAAIERVRWNPSSRLSAFAPVQNSSVNPGANSDAALDAMSKSIGGGNVSGQNMRAGNNDSAVRIRDDLFAVGTLGALNFIVRGLRELPGRKSVILFSDGVPLYTREGTNQRVLDSLRRLTDLANRSSVVIYSVDARGLVYLGPTAADDFSGAEFQGDANQSMAQKIEERMTQRRNEFLSSQEGLNYLAYQTGGFSVKNSNFLELGIQRVLRDQQNYYLLGYIPEETTFRSEEGRRKFHKISVKVKRPGARVRYRSGFYGVSDEEIKPAAQTPAQQMISAITSPFSSGEIGLRLTSMFANDPKEGPFVRSMLHLDADNIQFTEEADGWKSALIDVLAVAFGDNGRLVDESSGRYTIRSRADDFQKTLRAGLVYTHNLMIKKPGAYQLRIVVRDTASGRIGSANQFIEVPDVKKGHLTISGIVTTGVEDGQKSASPVAGEASMTNENANIEKAVAAAQATPAVRKLRYGMLLNYAFMVYNAKTDHATGLPSLESQVRVFRDGSAVYIGKVNPVALPKQNDWKSLMASGQLRLDESMEPGQYVLQVIITDKLAKNKRAVTSQWIDFELVK